MLNQGKSADIALTAAQRNQILQLAGEMATAEDRTSRLTRAYEEQERVGTQAFQAVADVLLGMFDGPMENLDQFIDKAMTGMADAGGENLDAFSAAFPED